MLVLGEPFIEDVIAEKRSGVIADRGGDSGHHECVPNGFHRQRRKSGRRAVWKDGLTTTKFSGSGIYAKLDNFQCRP